MLLENLIPNLPDDRLGIYIVVVGVIGAILLVYSQFVEAENRRDLIRMLGALAMLSYALSIANLVFSLAMLGIFLAALIEFVEIYAGWHKHTRKDVEVYEHIGKK